MPDCWPLASNALSLTQTRPLPAEHPTIVFGCRLESGCSRTLAYRKGIGVCSQQLLDPLGAAVTELTNDQVLAKLDADEPEIVASYAKHQAYNRAIKEMCEVSTRIHYQTVNRRKLHER